MVEHSQQSVHLGGIARAVCCYVPTLHARVALLLLDLCTYIHTYIHTYTWLKVLLGWLMSEYTYTVALEYILNWFRYTNMTLDGSFLPPVTKEAGYVHALSLAAIVHSVAKLCAQGVATSCTCVEEDLTLPQSDGTSFQQGCSDNVNFGVQFARNFLFKRHLGQGIEQTVEQHNMMIGDVVSPSVLQYVYLMNSICISLPLNWRHLHVCIDVGTCTNFVHASIQSP